MLKKKYRILSDRDFKSILKKGRFINNNLFLFKYTKNNLKNTRLGIVVSKKVSKKAVLRNLIKRRVREIIRSKIVDIKTGYDIIFIMRQDSSRASFSLLKKEVLTALSESNLLNK